MGVFEQMQDGTQCSNCGVLINDDPPGYPCRCENCEDTNPPSHLCVDDEEWSFSEE